MITLLVRPAELDAARLEVEGERFRHLFRARRLVVGQRLRVVDGAGRARCAEVLGLDRARAVLRLAEVES